MGWLALLREETRIPLTTETVVGRGPSADVRLREGFVSNLHAAITWSEGAWGVKDLGSHNGTALNGDPLAPGRRHKLREGDEISFGQASATWTLVDAGAPKPHAYAEGRKPNVGEGGLLGLPDGDDPVATVFFSPLGSWRLETEAGVRDVEDRESIEVDGITWLLRLPHTLTSTRTSLGGKVQRSLRDVDLVIAADDDRGGTIIVRSEDDEVSAPVGNTLSVLRRLAVARLEREGGWVDREELLDELSMTGNRLNVIVFRLRKMFTDLGFVDAAQIVERGHRRLRLGTRRVEVR